VGPHVVVVVDPSGQQTQHVVGGPQVDQVHVVAIETSFSADSRAAKVAAPSRTAHGAARSRSTATRRAFGRLPSPGAVPLCMHSEGDLRPKLIRLEEHRASGAAKGARMAKSTPKMRASLNLRLAKIVLPEHVDPQSACLNEIERFDLSSAYWG